MDDHQNDSVFLTARQLSIELSVKPLHWRWYNLQDGSRYSSEEVAELLQGRFCLDVSITLNTKTFKQEDETYYAAYLVFKTTDDCRGLHAVMTAVVNDDRRRILSRTIVCLYPGPVEHELPADVQVPQQRHDALGWNELELGRFSYEYETGNHVLKVTLNNPNNEMMSGLIIAGIELRPVDDPA